jgi:hypothetical protein
MNVRIAGIAGAIYAAAIIVSIFVGGLVPVLIGGALLVGLAYRLAAGGGEPRGGRQRNRDRSRSRG